MSVLGPFDFSGGFNTKTGPYDAPPNCVVDGQNMELVYGRFSKKKGNTQWTSAGIDSTSSILGLGYFQGFLVGASGTGKIKTASSTVNGGAWTDITGAVSFAAANNVWMAALNNILVIGGDGGTPIQWTGSGNCSNLPGSPPFGCVCGISVNNYLFMANNAANPSRLQWSAIADPTTWPGANFVDVLLEDVATKAFGIQAIFPFGEDIIIFKTNSVSRFYTNQLSGSLGPLVVVSDRYGCAGPQCVDKLPDGRIAFIGYNNHVYIYDGNTFLDISDTPTPQSNIQNTLNALTFQTAGFNQGFLQVYQAKNQIWISYPFSWTSALGVSYVSVIFIYDIENQIWLTPYPDQWVHKAVNYLSGKQYLITGGNDGFLYREDTGDTNSNSQKNSTAFDGYFTKSIAFGADNRKFIPRSLYFPLSTGNLNATVYYGANGYNNPQLLSSISITGSAQERKKVIPVNTSSANWNTMQIRFDGAVSNQPFMVAPIFISDEIESQV